MKTCDRCKALVYSNSEPPRCQLGYTQRYTWPEPGPTLPPNGINCPKPRTNSALLWWQRQIQERTP